MDAILQTIQSWIPESFDFQSFLMAALMLCGALLILGFIGRAIFGRNSVLNQSVSASIGIIFIYALTVVFHSVGINLKLLMSELPFVTISQEYLHIFSFIGTDYVTICGELLDMVILAFLVNLVNCIMPKGKKLFGWLFFRVLSVLLAMVLHTLVCGILNAFLPEGLLTWAPVILLALLVIMLLTGALKVVVGVAIGTVNPLIGFLYTFFFSNLVGKQLSKAVLTTAMLSALIVGLNYMGITAIYIGAAVLTAYIPLLIALLALWYVIGRLL